MQLVTGGAGFVGSHLVDALVSMGKRVRVLDHLEARPGETGERQRRRADRFGRAVDLIEADICDPEAVRTALKGVRRVFHLAHFTGSRTSLSHPEACLRTNVLGTQVLADGMTRAGVEQLVLCSHGLVYGEAGRRASRETDRLLPTTPFAASMVGAEAVATSWQAQTRGNLVIVRPFATYGPRMRPDSAVYTFLQSIRTGRDIPLFGDDTSRDYVFASDVIRVLVEARRVRSTTRPSIFNVASGRSLGILELVRELGVILQAPTKIACLPHQPGDVGATWGDPSHTAESLGITPRTTLTSGLERTLRWAERAG